MRSKKFRFVVESSGLLGEGALFYDLHIFWSQHFARDIDFYGLCLTEVCFVLGAIL